jgi:hypothetical protein
MADATLQVQERRNRQPSRGSRQLSLADRVSRVRTSLMGTLEEEVASRL